MKQLVTVPSMPWLPEIDSSWDVVRANHFLSAKKTIVGEEWSDYTLLSLTKAGVIVRDFTDRQGKLPEKFDAYQEVQVGDLVMCLFDIDETPRTVGISSHHGMITGAYTTFQFDQSIAVPRYFEYLLISIDDRKAFKAAYSGLRKTIRPSVFLSLRLPLPPLETQQRIADYLDRETAEIDAAVTDLDRYVELLEKRRCVVITTAVTGRDHQELKNSDSYWLGEVAAHWNVVPAWLVMRERSEKNLPGDVHLTPSQVYGVITQKHYMEITGNKVTLNLAGADNMKRVCPGDFVIHLRSFQGGIESSTIGGKVSNAYTVLVPTSVAHFRYYRWFMKSQALIEGLASSTDQLRDGQSINFSRFSRLSLPVPPLSEQVLIADYLDRETSEIDSLISESTKLRELLLKRRSVLITDVVTGRKQV